MNDQRINSQIVIDDQISDHAIIESTINGHCDKHISKSRKVNTWYKYDMQKLWQSLENSISTWNEIESSDVNTKMNWILNVTSNATNQFKRIKVIKINEDFFDIELEFMRNEKNRLYKIAQ